MAFGGGDGPGGVAGRLRWVGFRVGADVSELGFGVWHGGLCELHGAAAVVVLAEHAAEFAEHRAGWAEHDGSVGGSWWPDGSGRGVVSAVLSDSVGRRLIEADAMGNV